MQITYLLPFAFITSLFVVANDKSNTDNIGAIEKVWIYAFMADRFAGKPNHIEVKMLADGVLRKFNKPVVKSEIYSLGGYLFQIKCQTGLGEMYQLECLLNS